jgi:hypothetical protein
LAEYYEQEGAGRSIQIVIPTGQYTPQFLICDPPGRSDAAGPDRVAEDPAVEPPAHVPEETKPPAVPAVLEPNGVANPARLPRQLTQMQLWVAAGLLVLVLAVAAVLLSPGDPLDSFWRPVLSSPNPILLCFGDVEGGRHSRTRTAAAEDLTLLEYHGLPSEMMLVPDAITFSRFTGVLQSKGKRYRVASQADATFADLQYGPAVLIGLANNDWTERLVGKLRFTGEHRPPGRLIIRDRISRMRTGPWIILCPTFR